MAAPNQRELEAFMASMKQRESGGNYTAQSPDNGKGRGRATGAYQWLNATWGGYGGYARAMDAPPAVQEARAAQMFSAYYQRYGSWDLVALAWFAGPGRADTAAKYGIERVAGLSDVGGAKVSEYVAWVKSDMTRRLQADGYAGPGNNKPAAGNKGTAPDNSDANIFGGVARDVDDPLGYASGGPGTVGGGGGGGGGVGMTEVATSFGDGTLDLADSEKVDAEVEAKYGDMSDEEFLTEIYEDVLGRDPDKSGFDFWLGRLGAGTSRSEVYQGFYASDEGGNTEAPLLSEVELMIRQKYPDWAWAMDLPEVRDILLEATDPTRGLDDVTFMSRIRDTEWWKTTEATTREWDARASMDPATAARSIEAKALELQRKSTALGGNLDSDAAMALAEKVLRFGLTEAQINDSLAATFDSSDPRGDVAANLKQARADARAYMVNVDDAELLKWAQQVAVGTASSEDFNTRLMQLSKSKFTGNKQLSELIDAGGTPETFFNDHRQLLARELDLSASQVDLLDPKYQRILSSASDGVVRPMDLNETRKHIRENAEFNWSSTSMGKAKIADTTQALLRAFGKVA